MFLTRILISSFYDQFLIKAARLSYKIIHALYGQRLVTNINDVNFSATCVGLFSGQGITLGAHRCYTHKAYKVTKPIKILLFFLQTMAGQVKRKISVNIFETKSLCRAVSQIISLSYQNSIFTWVRDHKLHHTYSDTDADPHNSKRGFFFCHMGWLMVKKHPLVIKKQKELDVSELLADKMMMFQYK